MKEITNNLWDYHMDSTIAITTNGVVNTQGYAVMGKGCALEAKTRYPGLPGILGGLINRQGNHVYYLAFNIVSFPTKYHWKDKSDIELIKRSASELVQLTNGRGIKSVVMPRPGCGAGGLKWTDVKPVLEEILDDRFSIISWK